MKIYALSNRDLTKEFKEISLSYNFTVEPISFSYFQSLKKYTSLLKDNEIMISFHCTEIPLPPTFIKNFFDAWQENRFYLKCTGSHILLNGLMVELFGREALMCAQQQKQPLLPDGSLNVFSDERAKPYWFNMEEQRFYLLENYARFYGKPTSLCIETTPHCNLKCAKCQFHSLKSPYTTKANRSLPGNSMMSLDEWKRIVDMVTDSCGRVSISPAVRGECLLHRDIVPMVAHATKRGHTVGFYTNGNLLTEERSKGLIDAGINSIMFSLDAINEEQYDKFQPGGSYGIVLENMETLLKLRGNARIPTIGVSFCQSPENAAYFDEYLNFWKNRVDTVAGAIELDINNGHRAWKTFYPVPYRYPCAWLWKAMYIQSNGGVALCGLDMFQELNLGNAFQKDILSIWNGEAYRSLRENQAGPRRNLKFCHECICWTGSCYIEKIEGDNYYNIGPMSYVVAPYKKRHFTHGYAVRAKNMLETFGVSPPFIAKLQGIYTRLTK